MHKPGTHSPSIVCANCPPGQATTTHRKTGMLTATRRGLARRGRRIRKASAPFILGAMAGAIVALGVTTATARPAPAASTVQSFNDGFATSKQDDCQQGFRTACHWLGQAAMAPAASSSPLRAPLPRGFHWVPLGRRAARAACGTRHARAIGVWGGNGDTGAVVCSNGKAGTT